MCVCVRSRVCPWITCFISLFVLLFLFGAGAVVAATATATTLPLLFTELCQIKTANKELHNWFKSVWQWNKISLISQIMRRNEDGGCDKMRERQKKERRSGERESRARSEFAKKIVTTTENKRKMKTSKTKSMRWKNNLFYTRHVCVCVCLYAKFCRSFCLALSSISMHWAQ